MKYTAGMDAQRFHKLAEELAGRDPQLAARLRDVREAARDLREHAFAAVEAFRQRASELGASYLGHIDVSAVEPDDKHVDAVQFSDRARPARAALHRDRARSRQDAPGRPVQARGRRKVRAPSRRCAGRKWKSFWKSASRRSCERPRAFEGARHGPRGQPEHGQARGGAARPLAVLREGRGARLRRAERRRSAAARLRRDRRGRAQSRARRTRLGPVRSRRGHRGRADRAGRSGDRLAQRRLLRLVRRRARRTRLHRRLRVSTGLCRRRDRDAAHADRRHVRPTLRRAPGSRDPGTGAGNIGRLTGGALTRMDYGAQAVTCAWLRFRHPELYRGERA